MKTYSILFLMALNISCTSLMNPQAQPVHLIDGKLSIYMTTCSGMAETMGTCHEKAKKTCTQGYKVLSEISDSSGVHRKIQFQCK
jgi:hypothetical protein